MSHVTLNPYLLLVLAVLVPRICVADPSSQVPVGARAVALGSAFSAIADDATAIFWNPAGLTQLDHQEFMGNHANLFDTGLKNNFVAVVVPFSKRRVVAADWYRLGFGDQELDFRQDRFDLSYAVRFHPMLSVGVTAKYLRQDIALDQVDLEQGSGSGWGADIGVMSNPMLGLRLGLVVQDVFDTRIGTQNEGDSVLFPRNTRLAGAYTLRRWGTVALDIDDRYHLGAEFWPIDHLTLRAGFQDDRNTDEGATYSAGFGVHLGPIRFDYAYLDHPALESTNYFGFTMAFNFNPALIHIEKIETKDIYASLYKSYGHQPIAIATVRNESEEPLNATFRTEIPGITQTSSEIPVLLAPRRVERVPLTVVLPEAVMAREEDRYVQLNVEVQYKSLRLNRVEKSSSRSVFYSPGLISWSDGVGQAAAFITVDDPDLHRLARDALQALPTDGEARFGSRNVAYAAAVFDALGILGLRYVQDPDNPYTRMSQDKSAIDTVRYPRETLHNRGGDCDDTTVLTAALLGSLGIATMLADTPGHLSLLFDSGLHERHRVALGLDESLSLVHDRRVWIPLESTAIGEGFARAWARGAETCSRHAADGTLRLVEVDSAWSSYPPAEPRVRPYEAPPLDPSALQERIKGDAHVVQDWRAQASSSSGSEESALSASATNRIARVLLRAGRVREAAAKLEELAEPDRSSPMALNNLGAIHLADERADTAVEYLQKALDLEPEDPGIWLNLAVAQVRQGHEIEAERALSEGVHRCGSVANARNVLGIPLSQPMDDAEDRSFEETLTLLLNDLRRLETKGLPRVLYWKD